MVIASQPQYADSPWLFIFGALLGTTVLFSLLSIFDRNAGLAAIREWAIKNGFNLLRAKRRTFTTHWRNESSRMFQYYRIQLLDGEGRPLNAWLKLEAHTNKPAILDIIWD